MPSRDWAGEAAKQITTELLISARPFVPATSEIWATKIAAIIRAAAPSVSNERLQEMWDALKTQECADPSTAVRVSMISEAGFKKAMAPFISAPSDREAGIRDTIEQACSDLEFLGNASYGELRSSVETHREYTPAPDESVIGQGDAGYKHFKNWATPEEWAVAERVSGWFQQRTRLIEDALCALLAPSEGKEPK